MPSYAEVIDKMKQMSNERLNKKTINYNIVRLIFLFHLNIKLKATTNWRKKIFLRIQ